MTPASDSENGVRLPRSPLAANVTLRNGNVADLLALAGQSSIPATGAVTADIHASGTYGNPLGTANVQIVDASAYQQPIDHIILDASLADRLISLSKFELAAAGGTLTVNGTFHHPEDSFSTGHAEMHVATSDIQLSNVTPLQKQSPGAGGVVHLTADAAGDLRSSGQGSEFSLANLTADLSARSLRVNSQSAGDLTASARNQRQKRHLQSFVGLRGFHN